MHFDNYLSIVDHSNPGIGTSIRESVDNLIASHIVNFDCISRRTGLLYGQVQSGKTSQILGVIAAASDIGFSLFLLLTTDNIRLQEQTLQRAFGTLDTLNICGENDDLRFREGKLRKPTVVILKKNQSVLRRWTDIIASSGFCRENPIFIVDDEADSASLNTLINQGEQSSVNQSLQNILQLSKSSIYLQVTATPQSILLQRISSDWSPDFTHYFEPGNGYLGGNYFYSETSLCVRKTHDGERASLLSSDYVIPDGLRRAFWSFVVAGAHLIQSEERSVCNFLIHPGIKTVEHDTLERKITLFLEQIRRDLVLQSNLVIHELTDAWQDLLLTKSDLIDFHDLRECLFKVISEIKIVVVNSLNEVSNAYSSGMNIIIGGNSLGRGLTLPALHTVYYCRTARTPQADTCWQHSRIFGYDRDGALCRIYLPPILLRLFRELDEANDAMSGIIKRGNLSKNYSILSPKGTRPTRLNVIQRDVYDIWSGGVNYFPDLPLATNTVLLDSLLGTVDSDREVSIEFAQNIISLISVESEDPWQPDLVNLHITALKESGYDSLVRFIIRTNRNVTKNTGTLLSPNDRALTQSKDLTDRFVVVMYRLNGSVDQDWDGVPIWVPNVKFPVGTNFYHTIGNK